MNAERSARVLVVEDEENIAKGIAENLEAEGYECEVVGNGRLAIEAIEGGEWDLVLLDVMLPEVDGFTVCDHVRKHGFETPVLFLTARASVEDRIRGLEAGGDDYLPKPFHLDELLLRVKAILKRRLWYDTPSKRGQGSAAGSTQSATIEFGGNTFNFASFQGTSWNGEEHSLTKKEAMILKVLTEREGEIVTRDEILDQVWGYDLFPSSRTIDNFIVRLRKRFEPDTDRPRFFHTVRGMGYRFTGETGGTGETGAYSRGEPSGSKE